MRTLLLSVTLLALFYTFASALQISLDSSELTYNLDSLEDAVREKRQVENFDDDYPSAIGQSQNDEEEPGFWDRVVKVALKLFNKFMEWLNSS